MPHFQISFLSQSSKLILKLALCALWVWIGGPGICAQSKNTDNKADRNLKSAARINPSSLAMELAVPLGGYPGRAGNSLPLAFNYTSKVWRMTSLNSWRPQGSTSSVITDANPNYGERTAAGWTSSLLPPRIETRLEVYDQEGFAWNPWSGPAGGLNTQQFSMKPEVQ